MTRLNQLPWLNGEKQYVVAIVGDVILDEYLDGRVDRISPEAPVPIHLVKKRTLTAGGAANAARNIAKVGGHCKLFGVVGQDEAFEQLKAILKSDEVDTHGLIGVSDRITVKKSRITSNHHQLIRIDWEQQTSITQEHQDILFEKLLNVKFDALIISDYGKGTLPRPFVQRLIQLSKERKVPCLIDPKGQDYSRYKGADLIKPNRKEAHEALGLSMDIPLSGGDLGEQLQKQFEFKNVLVTLGPEGMVLTPESPGAEKVIKKTKAKEVFDVSGAGDTVISVMALAMASGCSFDDCLELASLAAGVVVEKWGTQAIEAHELENALWQNVKGVNTLQPSFSKIMNREDLAKELQSSWCKNKKVVFTNGCFDLLHAGHVRYLEAARNLGDILVLGINTDESIKRLKGELRPIVQLDQRMEVLAALKCIDYVVPFDEDTPLELIQLLKPNILAKGADYKEEDIVGGAFVKSIGGEVKTITLVPGISSTEIINRAKKAEKG